VRIGWGGAADGGIGSRRLRRGRAIAEHVRGLAIVIVVIGRRTTMEDFLQFATSPVKRNHQCIQLGWLWLLMPLSSRLCTDCPGRASERQKAFVQLSALKKMRRKNGWTIFSCTITYLKADALVPTQHTFRMLE
jgi:hypothetical protein